MGGPFTSTPWPFRKRQYFKCFCFFGCEVNFRLMWLENSVKYRKPLSPHPTQLPENPGNIKQESLGRCLKTAVCASYNHGTLTGPEHQALGSVAYLPDLQQAHVSRADFSYWMTMSHCGPLFQDVCLDFPDRDPHSAISAARRLLIHGLSMCIVSIVTVMKPSGG